MSLSILGVAGVKFGDEIFQIRVKQAGADGADKDLRHQLSPTFLLRYLLAETPDVAIDVQKVVTRCMICDYGRKVEPMATPPLGLVEFLFFLLLFKAVA